MIEKNDLAVIGKFQKTHALRGELNALLQINEEYIEDGNPVIILMDSIPVPFYAESVRPKGASSFLIKLSGVDDVEEASKIVNKEIYALKKDMEAYIDEDMMLEDDIEGFKVEDCQFGVLGTVDYIDDTTANVLLVVSGENDGVLYIPFTDEFINKIDPENKLIETSIPVGLLGLNMKKEE